MLRGGNPVPINSPRVQIKGPALAFQSVSYSDSSWYRCNYLLEQDWRCYDINVQIQGNLTHCNTFYMFSNPFTNEVDAPV